MITIISLITAVTGLVGAISALIHSNNTRKSVDQAKTQPPKTG